MPKMAGPYPNRKARSTPRRAARDRAKAEPAQLPLAARRHPLIAEVERGLHRCGVMQDQKTRGKTVVRIVIGVSGGADSVALLLGCLAISRRRSFSPPLRLVPIAVHVHHHLRESADADADWVADLCRRFGIELHLEHVHPGRLPGNLAANARRLRYDALRRLAHEVGAGFVAVAHHGEDQLETIIAALCRGAGLEGLAGMPWARCWDESVKLIRPLLAVRKSDCESFCKAAAIQWRDDPSNIDITKVRARLRRDVLPVLEELWPDAPRRVAATADLVSAAKAALHEQLDRLAGPASQRKWPRAALAGLAVALIAAVLRRAALDQSPEIADELNQRHLLQAAETIRSDDRRPHSFDWPGELRLNVTAKQVSLRLGKGKEAARPNHGT